MLDPVKNQYFLAAALEREDYIKFCKQFVSFATVLFIAFYGMWLDDSISSLIDFKGTVNNYSQNNNNDLFNKGRQLIPVDAFTNIHLYIIEY